MGLRVGEAARWGLALSIVIILALNSSLALANTVLYDDLSDSEVGKLPLLWETVTTTEFIEVVTDSGTPSGKAMRFSANPNVSNTGITLRPQQGTMADAYLIGVDHAVRWESGRTNIYFENIPGGGVTGHNAHWYVANGEVGYVYTENNQVHSTTVTQLQDGWNQVRIIMHLEANEVFLFVNDMEEPAVGPLPFRVPFATLENVQIRLNAAAAATSLAESYFGDFHIWMIESQ